MIEQVSVRRALPDDEPSVLALCWAAQAEMPDRRISTQKVQDMVRASIANGGVGVVDVAGDIKAMIGLVITSAWCSDDLEIQDWLTFVRADCRHLGYFPALIGFAKAEADRLRMPLLLGFVGGERAEAKSRAYRQHLPRFGEFFRYLPTQAA